MKKKDLKQKLQLHKKTISNLDTSMLKGGTDPTTVIISVETIELTIDLTIETIKTRKTNRTAHDACTIIATCYCSLTCPEKCNQC
ncbi:MAG: class I lanthipeptide [Bacteroidota bacterium]